MAFDNNAGLECIETGTGQTAMKGGVKSTRYDKNPERVAAEDRLASNASPDPEENYPQE